MGLDPAARDRAARSLRQPASSRLPLRRLARLYGVQSSYEDAMGVQREAGADAVVEVLRQLGAPIAVSDDAADALRDRELALWRRVLEPVVVAWTRAPASLCLRIPDGAPSRVELGITLEDGASLRHPVNLLDATVVRRASIQGARFRRVRVPLPRDLPVGYHRLALELNGNTYEALLLVAPARAYGATSGRGWGVFMPLYALRRRNGSGVSDLGDLRALATWVKELGGDLVATLPLLATFLGPRPYEPSPYAPVSRLFWNELFADLRGAAVADHCAEALGLLAAREFRNEARALRESGLVDYRREAALRREVLDRLAACFHEEGGAGRAPYRRFVKGKPLLEEYARFRAAVEKTGLTWHEWPERMRAGVIEPGDYDPYAARTHVYAQYLAETQLNALARDRDAAGLYLDLPLGVSADGFDVWKERTLFGRDVSVGAPPDPFFADGQVWGFPPVIPSESRESGHRYLIEAFRNHFRYASMLRLDHVMGLHRMFWVPRGRKATEGVYVRYPAEELYAILCIESNRHRCRVVGEDLGTVSRAVRDAMQRRGIYRMFVVPFELREGEEALRTAPVSAVASLNTHDMPPFASFWGGQDIERRHEWGWLNREQAEEAAQERASQRASLVAWLKRRGRMMGRATPRGVLRGLLRELAASPARFVLANLEDLWLETEPQNVPGTTDESPNWRRRARLTLEAMQQQPQIVETLSEIAEGRHNGGDR